ncbi:MAG: glutaminase domain-containing protein [Fimbriimonadales bacterium]
MAASLAGLAVASMTRAQTTFRPPAVPLVTSDPYLSIWSEADRLTDDVTRHWTHRPHPLTCLIRVDGKTYRLMGNEPVPALLQAGLTVTPTRTIYKFMNKQVAVVLTFMTPMLPDDLDVLARPVTYLTWKVRSTDGTRHSVALYESTSTAICMNETDQPVAISTETAAGLTMLEFGLVKQTMLRPAGDDARINWGYGYAAAPSRLARPEVGSDEMLISRFASLPPPVDSYFPKVVAFNYDFAAVGPAPVERHMMIGYDEIWSIDYFGRKLQPYWRRNGMTPERLFEEAERDYPSLVKRCENFDNRLTADLTKAGGAKYAQIAALSYRECVAACGLAADAHGQPLLFTKENTSNGDIATVDVIFPMDPIWLLLSPTLAKASLVSNFDYAASSHWKFPNAPHDLGTYPQVFGRDDGGEGMPVEESGNMIILTDAIAHTDGNARFASRWWPQLTQWAKYLEKYGLDPENQLCTDDFMGHLAHNANLSIKAIVALAAYGDLCKMRGSAAEGKRYLDMARVDAKHWMKVADAGDHSLLAFDRPNTWSQKYNLVWDRILGLNVFPPEVARKEIAYYKTLMQPYGLPLDSRTHLTKTDWSIWSATMAEKQSDFEGFIAPIYRYLNETTARDPIADSYVTDKVKSGGMHARPVVGGFFIRMLADPAMWKKWASRDKAKVGNWAPLPLPPVITEIVPDSRKKPAIWRYTTRKPSQDWSSPAFDDSNWQSGPGGFGTAGTPNGVFGTRWDTDDIWIRRKVTLPSGSLGNVQLIVYHDEDVEVYIDGVLALKEPDYLNEYRAYDIYPAAKQLLKPGKTIWIAAHCHQTAGGQGIDIGFAKVTYPKG